jgi:hypothetical protein
MLRAPLLRATALIALVAALSSLSGCKKDADTEALPAPSASAPAPVATTDPGDAGAPADAAPPPPAVTSPQRGSSIDACCGALAAVKGSGKDAKTKASAARAAAICPGIAARVKSGETSRAAGLGLIKGSLSGVSIPGECR